VSTTPASGGRDQSGIGPVSREVKRREEVLLAALRSDDGTLIRVPGRQPPTGFGTWAVPRFTALRFFNKTPPAGWPTSPGDPIAERFPLAPA